jgi:sugar diacid utilization regulator
VHVSTADPHVVGKRVRQLGRDRADPSADLPEVVEQPRSGDRKLCEQRREREDVDWPILDGPCRGTEYDREIVRSLAPSGERRTLHQIISTVGSSLDLDEVLEAVVALLSEASAVHACFVYFLEDRGERLVLRAASEPYVHLVGEIALGRGEGLAWWAIEHREPAFIRENALADPRVKYVPELEEEKFQSLVAVPVLGKDGGPMGSILLHTEAPREFTEAEADFLVSSAALVAGAIENAHLYEEMRRRVGELEELTELAETVARAESVDELLPAVTERARALLGAAVCASYLLDRGGEQLRLCAIAPAEAEVPRSLKLTELGPELSRRKRTPRIALPLIASGELLGALTADGTAAVELARAVANLTGLALKKIELIEDLTEKNLIKDFFEELVSGRAEAGSVVTRAKRLGFALDAPYLVVVAGPADDELDSALAAAAPGSLFDRREDAIRGLLRVPPNGVGGLLEEVRRLQSERSPSVAVGISNLCRGTASFPAGFEEARHALLGSTVLQRKPGVMTFDELGPYKYLLRMSLDADVRDSYREAVAKLADYDRERSTSLLLTLEEFLRRRGNISATSETLFVHPNTLRQRLRRISELCDLDLRTDDWLMIEIAVKLVRLKQTLERNGADTSNALRV